MVENWTGDEEMCGFLVTEERKKLWAVQLECLEQIKRVCKKHDITYYAIGGTLLGAVRHKGFIPWDDDIDVIMLEKDYLRFLEVAPKEVEYPFFFQSFETDSNAGCRLSRMRKSTTTCCTDGEYRIAEEGYNLGIFVDILPVSGVGDTLFQHLRQLIPLYFYKAQIGGCRYEQRCLREGKFGFRQKLKLTYILWAIFGRKKGLAGVSRRCTEVALCYPNSKRVAFILNTLYDKRYTIERSYFESTVELPFENTTISAPVGYEDYLTSVYGNYNEYVIGDAVHTLYCYSADIPFTEHPVLVEHFENIRKTRIERK